jgi:hypothetical protein
LKVKRGRIFIYKIIENNLGLYNNFFRIIKKSHRMNIKKIFNTKTKDIHLKPDQIIINGDLVIKYSLSDKNSKLLIAIYKN